MIRLLGYAGVTGNDLDFVFVIRALYVNERPFFVFLGNAGVYHQLQEYEQKIFGSLENQAAFGMPVFSSPVLPSVSFNYPKPSDSVQIPAFNFSGAASIFARPDIGVPPQEFTFGAAAHASDIHLNSNQNPNSNMD